MRHYATLQWVDEDIAEPNALLIFLRVPMAALSRLNVGDAGRNRTELSKCRAGVEREDCRSECEAAKAGHLQAFDKAAAASRFRRNWRGKWSHRSAANLAARCLLWVKSVILGAPTNVRYYSNSDRRIGLYSITSSARATRFGGISSPRALAVLRLIVSSNLDGCSTGKSAGLAPLKILSI